MMIRGNESTSTPVLWLLKMFFLTQSKYGKNGPPNDRPTGRRRPGCKKTTTKKHFPSKFGLVLLLRHIFYGLLTTYVTQTYLYHKHRCTCVRFLVICRFCRIYGLKAQKKGGGGGGDLVLLGAKPAGFCIT